MSKKVIEKYRWLKTESLQNEPVDAEEERAYAVELYSALETAKAKLSKMEEALQATPAVIPTTWLDPLLTGPNALLEDCDCPSLERLLLHLKANLEAHASEALAGGEEA